MNLQVCVIVFVYLFIYLILGKGQAQVEVRAVFFLTAETFRCDTNVPRA